VLATGLVVDDAITVIEDTTTKKKEGLTAVEAAKSTMDELFTAVIATSLVLFAVFVPVLFFPGATGSIYKQFAATIIFSVSDLHLQCAQLLSRCFRPCCCPRSKPLPGPAHLRHCRAPPSVSSMGCS
jgi:multidrug efflux pump subunit AcrB